MSGLVTGSVDRLCAMPHGLGEEEPGHMARGQGRGGQDRSAVALAGELHVPYLSILLPGTPDTRYVCN